MRTHRWFGQWRIARCCFRFRSMRTQSRLLQRLSNGGKLMRSLVVISMFLVTSVGHAIPIMYDEGADGDLNGQTLNLDIGVNTVSGEWTLAWPGTIDYDPFFFVVPTGSVVTNVTLVFDGSGVSLPSDFFLVSTYRFFDGSPSLLETVNIQLPGGSSPLQPLGSFLPLAADTYRLFQSGAFLIAGSSESLTTGDGGSVDYTWSFTLEALPATQVPEPGTLGLFCAGLLGLGFARRRSALGNSG